MLSRFEQSHKSACVTADSMLLLCRLWVLQMSSWGLWWLPSAGPCCQQAALRGSCMKGCEPVLVCLPLLQSSKKACQHHSASLKGSIFSTLLLYNSASVPPIMHEPYFSVQACKACCMQASRSIHWVLTLHLLCPQGCHSLHSHRELCLVASMSVVKHYFLLAVGTHRLRCKLLRVTDVRSFVAGRTT